MVQQNIEIRTALPGPEATRIIEEDHQLLSTSLSRTAPLVGKVAHGAYVEDIDGNIFLDFGSGIAVTTIGHNHPRVVNAIREQADLLIHVNSCDYLSIPQVDYARRLTALSPGTFRKRVFFSNSGTEAVEAGIKAAKFHSKRSGIIAFIGGFHGRTMGSLALTSNSPVSRRYYTSSLMPNVAFAPYPYCYRCPFGHGSSPCCMESLRYLKEWVLGKLMPVEDCAAIVVEPILGSFGIIVPPDEFLRGLELICRENDIYFMVDEVQTGFGKTGEMFASQYFGITPDILCLSKAIAAGLPMGATVTRAELLDWDSNTHENTLGGNPVVLAAARAVLDVFEDEELLDAACQIGTNLMSGLRSLQESYELIGDVRGVGAMIGIEFVKDRETKEPAVDQRERFIRGCFERGLLVLGAGPSSIRLLPPLIVSDEEVDRALNIMAEVLGTI